MKIFGDNATLDGTWNVDEAYPEWFGAVVNLSTFNNIVPFQKAIDNFDTISLIAGTYYFDATGVVDNVLEIRNIRGIIGDRMHTTLKVMNIGSDVVFIRNYGGGPGSEGLYLENVICVGDDANHGVGLFSRRASDNTTCYITLKECFFQKFSIGVGSYAYLSKFERVVCSQCDVGINLYSGTSAMLNLCSCFSNRVGFMVEHMIYSQLSCCTADLNTECAYRINSCQGVTLSSCGAENNLKFLNVTDSNEVTIDTCWDYVDKDSPAVSGNLTADTIPLHISIIGSRDIVLRNCFVLSKSTNGFDSNPICHVENAMNSTRCHVHFDGCTFNNVSTTFVERGLTGGADKSGYINITLPYNYNIASSFPSFSSDAKLKGVQLFDMTNKRVMFGYDGTWLNAMGHPTRVDYVADLAEAQAIQGLTNAVDTGMYLFNKALNKPMWRVNGGYWYLADGFSAAISRKSTTAKRPTPTQLYGDTEGFVYYDTDLHKYILWAGSTLGWTNLDGTALVS